MSIKYAALSALGELWAKVKAGFCKGNGHVFVGTCDTAAATVEKAVTCADFAASDLVPGAVVFVRFANTNSGAVGSLKLNVNSTGAKAIKHLYNGSPGNIPSAGYLKANQTYQFYYDGTYWVTLWAYNTDQTACYQKYYNAIKAESAIRAASIIGGRDGAWHEIQAGSTHDLSHPLLWTTGAIAADATQYNNIYTQCYDRTFATCYSSFTGTANSIVWLVGTVSGNTFTADGTTFLTCSIPSSEDGKVYIPIGRLGNQSNGKTYFNFFVDSQPALFAYVGGAFQPVMPSAQPTLVSGTNIKTVNGNSLLGSGDLVTSGTVIDILPRANGGTGVTAYQQTSVSLASVFSNSPSAPCRHNGVVCTTVIYAAKLSSALSSGSSLALGTIPDGWRPLGTVSGSVCVGDVNGNYANVYALCTAAGAITLYNRSGLSIPTSAALTLTLTYVI